MAWYIEAWDVFDGMAFATHWNAGEKQPDEIVYVAAPDFYPVAVRDRATALWGTRGTFQEGFFEGDREVAFRSLDEIVEAVRRGFLGGGVGFDPGEGGGPEGAPNLPNPGDTGDNSRPDEGVVALVEFIASSGKRPGAARPSPSMLSYAVAQLLEQIPEADRETGESIFARPLRVPGHSEVRTWADHLLVAACDHNYLRSIHTTGTFAPLLAAAMVAIGRERLPVKIADLDEALDWLVRELAGRSLRGNPAVEKALAEIPRLKGAYPPPAKTKPNPPKDA